MQDDSLVFADDAEVAAPRPASPEGIWRILIVDDDPGVHTVTRMVLRDVTFMGRTLEFLGAHSAAEALPIVEATPDIAIALIDVVMETDDAGLRLVEQIRGTLENHRTRIILRTGQAGLAPERDVILRYDINDYKEKTELTAQKLFTAIVTALRSYRDILTIEAQAQAHHQARREEARILEIANAVSSELQLDDLLHKIIGATTQLLGAERSSLFLYDAKTDELVSRVAEGLSVKEIRFPSTAGLAGACFTSGDKLDIPDAYADPRFNQEFDRQTGFRTRNILCMPIRTKQGRQLGVVQVLNKIGGPFSDIDAERLRAFGAQFAIALENAQLFEDVLNARNYNESILKSLSNGVITLDTEFRIIKANSAARRILNWGETSPVGMSSANVFAGSNKWVLDSLERVRKSGEVDTTVDGELAIGQAGGAHVNMTTVPLIDVKEQPIGFMLVLEDITNEKRVKTTMSRYMSRQLVEQVMSAGDNVLGGATQEVSVLFSDIRKFTTLSEKLGARGIVSLLNAYFTDMVEIIFRNEGILDKYIGDAIMAVFGTPFVGDHDADNAIATANEMMIALRVFNQRIIASGSEPLDIGVGVATGEVVVGNIGSSRRMDYTVIGDSVNLASRLEGANKLYGTTVLVSGTAVAAAKRPHRFRSLDLIRVKGKEQAVEIFECLDHYADADFPNMGKTIAAFEKGLAAYRGRDWKGAISSFDQALALNRNDGPSALYLERSRHYLAHPPGEDWGGVWTMETK